MAAQAIRHGAAVRRSASRHQRAAGHLERAVGRRVRLEARRDRPFDRRAISARRLRHHRVVKPRERSREPYQKSLKLGVRGEAPRAARRDLDEARVLEQLRHPLRVGERERSRVARCARLHQAALGQHAPGKHRPRVRARARPTPPARAARRCAAHAGSRAAPPPGRPSACSPSGTAPRRRRHGQVDPFRVQHSELDVVEPSSAARARAASSIASAWSEMITPPAGADQLGRQQAGLPDAGGELEHALAGLERERVDQPVRSRGRTWRECRSCRRAQPAAASSQLCRLLSR